MECIRTHRIGYPEMSSVQYQSGYTHKVALGDCNQQSSSLQFVLGIGSVYFHSSDDIFVDLVKIILECGQEELYKKTQTKRSYIGIL